MIQQIVYTGHVRMGLDAEVSAQDVRKASTFCEGLGVTGLTLYAAQTFITVLEGEREYLDIIFDAVKTDPRLSNVQKIFAEAIASREFETFRYGVLGRDFSKDVPAAFLLNSRSYKKALPHAPSPVLGVFFNTFTRVNNLPFAQTNKA